LFGVTNEFRTLGAPKGSKMKKAANGGGQLTDFKSGTRDSNPRLQPWQIGGQLKTKNNGAYGFRSELMNSTQYSWYCVGVLLNDVEVMYNFVQKGTR